MDEDQMSTRGGESGNKASVHAHRFVFSRELNKKLAVCMQTCGL